MTDVKEQVRKQRLEDIEKVSGQRREGTRQRTENRRQRTEKGEWKTDNFGRRHITG